MFSMAFTACPERGRHTNKQKKDQRGFWEDCLPNLELSCSPVFLVPLLFIFFLSLSFPLFFPFTFSVLFGTSGTPQSVHTEGQSRSKGGFCRREATEGRQRRDPLQVWKESWSLCHVVRAMTFSMCCGHLRWGVANGAGGVETLGPLWSECQGMKEYPSRRSTRSQSLEQLEV